MCLVYQCLNKIVIIVILLGVLEFLIAKFRNKWIRWERPIIILASAVNRFDSFGTIFMRTCKK